MNSMKKIRVVWEFVVWALSSLSFHVESARVRADDCVPVCV